MSWLRRLLKPFIKPIKRKRCDSPFAIEFDRSLVTKSVKANLRRNIDSLNDIEKTHIREIYEVALRSVLAGGDMHMLSVALMKIEGMTRGRAVEITRSLHNKATEQINRERMLSLGITHAIWMYSNAPCMVNPRHPTDAEIRQDAAHTAVNGKKYEIAKGLFVDGKWTRPGVEEGCRCSARSVLPWTK